MKNLSVIETPEQLKAELKKLQNRCKQIEDQLDDNIDALKDNYKMMAFNSIIGNRLKSAPFLASIAGMVIGSPKAQEFIAGFFEKIINKGSGFFEKLVARFFPGDK